MTQEAHSNKLRLVIALGGNAILRKGENGTIEEQFAHADEAMASVARLARAGHTIMLVHGNGPVVGNIVIRNEAARDTVAPMPLYIADADSEGGIGYMLQQALYNRLNADGVRRPIATLVTQTVVAPDDPAFTRPTKPIGPYFTAAEASEHTHRDGWVMAEEKGRGWRRLVPSPRPLYIVEAQTAVKLAEDGTIVIVAGGGGVPVVESAGGMLSGIDAVIDKDWAASLLACALQADLLAVVMESDRLYHDWGSPNARPIDELDLAEARRLTTSGEMALGSVGPKLEACVHFVESCGGEAVICSSAALENAVIGRAGTRIGRGSPNV
jgi:carbamate kinase